MLGGSGAMGAPVADRLAAAGHDVVRASRRTGVDAATGTGLAAAVEGADVVIDCLNVVTTRRSRAVGFFTAAAGHVVDAARSAHVGHLVVLSIVNVTDQAVRRALGYYAGKAAQEETYAGSGLPVSVVATTAWFSLAEQFLEQGRFGPVALIPAMRLQPVHPDAAADLLAEVGRGPAPDGVARHRLAGPEPRDAPAMGRDLAAARRLRTHVQGVPFPLSREFRCRALLPRDDAGATTRIDDRRYADWLARPGYRPRTAP